MKTLFSYIANAVHAWKFNRLSDQEKDQYWEDLQDQFAMEEFEYQSAKYSAELEAGLYE